MDKLGVITSFLHNIVVYNIPLLYGTVGEIVVEKSGSLNLGVEGIMAVGAIFGYIFDKVKFKSGRKSIPWLRIATALIPVVTILGGSLPSLFSGALITEQLFSIPGIGYTAYQSMIVGDIPFTMFYLSFMAILTLLGNLISDILYAVVDPRVRYS